MTEFANCSLMGPGSCRPEVGDFEILFERECCRHDLAVNCANRVIWQATSFSFLAEATEQFLFTLGRVDFESVLFLDLTDFVDNVGSLIEKADDVGIDGIDFDALFFEAHKNLGVSWQAARFPPVRRLQKI